MLVLLAMTWYSETLGQDMSTLADADEPVLQLKTDTHARMHTQAAYSAVA